MSTSIQSELTRMNNYTNKMDAEKGKERMGASTLDKHAFLRLLTQQLKNQDPLKPMDNMQFIQQQAMFTQIEETQNLSKAITASYSMSQASSLIGKQVEMQDPDNPQLTIPGVVQAAHINNGQTSLEINNQMYPMENIIKISNTTENQ